MIEEIIKTCEPLIKSIAHKFYGIDYEDLYQVGRLGVINAYNHYQDNKETKFTTFAYQYIFGQMYDYVTKSNMIKQNRDTLKLAKLIDKAKIYLTQSLGKEPNVLDIANYLDITPQSIYQCLEHTSQIISLDKEVEEDTNLYNTIKTTNINDEYIDLSNSLSNLTPEEQELINLRYYQDLSQSQTAKILGINQVKVSREEKKVLTKMHEYLKCA